MRDDVERDTTSEDDGGGSSADGLTVAVGRPRTDVVVVRAVGEIDLLTAPRWARALEAALRLPVDIETGPAVDRGVDGRARRRLVCDLTGVTFLGASGLAVLVETADRAASLGVCPVVVADTRPVLRVLALTGLDRHLPVDARVVDAVTSTMDRCA